MLHSPTNDPNGVQESIAFYLDLICVIFFMEEILHKCFVFGIIANGPNSYFRNAWNVFDFIITATTIIDLALPISTYGTQTLFMLLRALRIMKVLDIHEGLRLCIKSILNGLKLIAQAFSVVLIVIFVFAVIGIAFFKGTFYYCQLNSSEGVDIEIKTIYDCMNLGGEWRNRDFHYDNIFMAMIALFELFTAKCWINTSMALPDSIGIDFNPKENHRPYAVLFGVLYMVIGLIFTKALLIGVVSNTFNRERAKIQGVSSLTTLQKSWVRLCKIIFKTYPVKMVICNFINYLFLFINK